MKVICIDGGATKVSGGIVDKIDSTTYKIVSDIKTIKYADDGRFNFDFTPVNIIKQRSFSQITKQELSQSAVYIDSIISIINCFSKYKIEHISIGMPGIKTTNCRGIQIMLNGPRIINLCDALEQRLDLKNPISRLENDSDMCAMGENFSKEGSFKGIENGYYLGGGTGSADGLKLNGEIISFDNEAEWIAKTWELSTIQGLSLEKFSSMNGINNLRASKSDKEIGRMLGKLIFERIVTIYSGWDERFLIERKLNKNHAYQGILLERIIIGQKLSDFLGTNDGLNVFQNMISQLTEETLNAPSLIKNYYIKGAIFDTNKIILSNLRSSPIIGLGAKAWEGKC